MTSHRTRQLAGLLFGRNPSRTPESSWGRKAAAAQAAGDLGGTTVKRVIVLLASVALVATGLYSPATGQETPPPVVPETVVLEDPFGDANGLNDQGHGARTGFQGDNGTPADAGNASDIGKVWFTDDETTISAHIQTELPGPGSQAIRYDLYTAKTDDAPGGCVWFTAFIAGKAQGQTTTWQGADAAKLFDACNEGTNWFDNGVEAEVTIATLEDGTGLITIKAPKEFSPFVATGQTLAGTTVTSRILGGVEGLSWTAPLTIDNTKPGVDYLIAGPPEVDEEEPKVPPGCKKGKGKKKGCTKKPKP